MPWDFVVALPAVSLRHAVEAGHAAVVPPADPRYQVLTNTQRGVRAYLSRFKTAFGRRLEPAIVIRDTNGPIIAASDLSALRNIIAVSAVIDARARRCTERFVAVPTEGQHKRSWP